MSISKREWERWCAETEEKKIPSELEPPARPPELKPEDFARKIFRKLFGRKP